MDAPFLSEFLKKSRSVFLHCPRIKYAQNLNHAWFWSAPKYAARTNLSARNPPFWRNRFFGNQQIVNKFIWQWRERVLLDYNTDSCKTLTDLRDIFHRYCKLPPHLHALGPSWRLWYKRQEMLYVWKGCQQENYSWGKCNRRWKINVNAIELWAKTNRTSVPLDWILV